MSPELEDVLRKIVQNLKAERKLATDRIWRNAIDAVINAVAATIMQLREPK